MRRGLMKKRSIKKGLFFLVIFALVLYVYGAWSLKRLTWTPGTSSWVDFAGFSDSDTLHIAYSDNTLGNAEIFFKKKH